MALLSCMDATAVNNPVSYLGAINDCDAIKYNGEYYITGNWLKGDMLCSRDLMSWGGRKHVYSWTAGWHGAEDGRDPNYDIHGTHLRYMNGTFHLYAHLGINDGIVHATSANIWGPYLEPVNTALRGGAIIDADTFLDDDGKLYYYDTVRSGGHTIQGTTMSDPSTFGNAWYSLISPQGWEGSVITEGSKVFKYRGRYYMLYNGNGTEDPNYAIGAVEASSPLGLNNSQKYSNNPIVRRTTPAAGKPEITHIGQSWVVEGLNGFEKWFGYFAVTSADGRTQRIDRMHFFDRKLFIDGPTDRYTPGYHPAPSKPQLLNIFAIADGAVPSTDWTVGSGAWNVVNEELRQTTATGFNNAVINRDSANHFLAEANLKLIEGSSARAGLAMAKDGSNWLRVGLDQTANRWFYQRMSDGAYDTADYALPAGFNFQTYHKIQLCKNGNTVSIKIDDIPAPTLNSISVNFDGAALPELFTDGAQAAFDGIIYTIGWDEFDSGVMEWEQKAGIQTYGSDGITINNGYSNKGDLMQEYEFSAQVYQASGEGSMGLGAVTIDENNWLDGRIDTASNELVISGRHGGTDITEQRVSVASKSDYNLRVVKLSDRVIFFVDGFEKLTVNKAYGPSNVGLVSWGMTARFNGIMTYRTEPDVIPAAWGKTDIGTVGFPGTLDYSDHAFYLSGSGHDIWGNNDGFTYAHTDASGDWEMSARIVNLDESDFYAKAAVMFRNDLADNSAMAMVCSTGGDDGLASVQFIWRDEAGEGTGIHEISDVSYPVWVKLTRDDSTFTGSYSTDGTTWNLIGTATPPLNSAGKIGMGVTSHNNDRIATAVFDNVDLIVPTPIAAGQWLQLNFTDGFYANAAGTPAAPVGEGGQRNWNYITTENSGYNASTDGTRLIDSLGNTVANISLSASGWNGKAWSGGAVWGGNGIETAGADALGGNHLMGQDETSNFWWVNGEATITIQGLDTGLTYNVRAYALHPETPGAGVDTDISLNGTLIEGGKRGDRWASDTTPYVWTGMSATGGNLAFTATGANPVFNAIVIEAVENLSALTPGSIGNSQEINEDEDPAAFTSTTAATGNGAILYQWQEALSSSGSWSDISGATSATYAFPNQNGVYSEDTEIFARRKATDTYNVEYSNVVSLKLIKVLLNPGTISNSQTIYEDETPAAFTSTGSAAGNGAVSYQWQQTLTPGDGGSWVDISNATGATYAFPNQNGAYPTDTEIFARRKATDTYNVEYSNVVSLKLIKVLLNPMVQDQWLQINFTDGFYANTAGTHGAPAGEGGQRNWNYITTINSGYNASTDSTGLIDSLGNRLADISLSASGWSGGGWSGGAVWGGNGIETAGADGLGENHLMDRDETINFWWSNGDGQTITISGLSTGLAYNVKLYSINNGTENEGETLAVDLNGTKTDFFTELDRWNSTTTPYVWDGISATASGDLAFTFDVNIFENPVINAIVIEAIESLLSYTKWSEEKGLTGANALRDANPDGDALNNLAEYALGGDPNVADTASVMPTVEISQIGGGSNAVDYIYKRRLNATSLGLTYGLNVGTNLTGAWEYVGTTRETGSIDINQDFESVTNSIPFAGEAGFVQLKVTED